ncbi:palmitoyltransferase ZDHHC6 isoform X1 [Agelaius tricolor]
MAPHRRHRGEAAAAGHSRPAAPHAPPRNLQGAGTRLRRYRRAAVSRRGPIANGPRRAVAAARAPLPPRSAPSPPFPSHSLRCPPLPTPFPLPFPPSPSAAGGGHARRRRGGGGRAAVAAMVGPGALQRARRLCHWGPAVALAVVAVCSATAMADAALWYWPLDTAGGSVNFVMLLNWTVMILYNYFSAMFVGPGYVPLGWTPEKSQDCMYLQYCKVCQSYKAPRSHHCRKCNRCVMKMDHHCPWINNCCGYQNHASFTLFLLLAPLGCIHASFIFIMTMYTQLYNRISFGWSSVKIDMSAAKRDPRPIIPFGLSAFAASLFALGLALGTTIAVGMLFIIQMKVILTNKTSIESWIEEKAKDRIQYYQTGETFIFPYDMGSKWKNFRQVFTWSGIPEGDGLDWPVRDGCHQYSLTIEQLKQKADKRVRSVRYRAIEDYSGVCCPVTKGVKTFFTTPCTEEPRIALSKGDLILATRGLKHWMYGEKILISAADGGIRERGWFPRNCVEKYQYDSETDQPVDGEKKSK